MTTLFWVLVITLAYSYIGYGVLLIVLAAIKRPAEIGTPSQSPSVAVLIAAHNEEDDIGAKLDGLLGQQGAFGSLAIIVVSDGSTDGTHQAVQAFAARGVRLLVTAGHVGKIAALNLAISEIDSDLVVFTDANSQLRPGALDMLLRHFADPSVGCVCGAIGVPEKGRGWIAKAESLYWRYDHALKRAESRLGGAVSAQGSLYAVRRDLLAPIPSAVADDLNNSLRAVLHGYQIVFEPAAVTEEPVTSNIKGEFGRRVRSTERGWRGLMVYRALFNPLRFGFYSVKLASHKLLRRLTPFIWLGLAVQTIFLIGHAPIYTAAGVGQALFYGLAISAWLVSPLRKLPGVSTMLFFVGGHLAMAMGVINALSGRRSDRWKPLRNSPSRP